MIRLLPERHALPVLIAASVLWGLIWLPLKTFHAQGVHGVPLLLVAYGGVGLLLAPVLWRQRRQWHGEGPWLWLIVVLGGYANLAFATALVYGDVVRSMVLFYLVPVWGVLGGRVFLGEVVTPLRWLAAGIAVLGAFLVLGGAAALASPPAWTDLVALSAGFAFAMNNVTFRATQGLPVASKVAAMFAGCLLFAGAASLSGVQPWPSGIPAPVWGLLALFGVAWVLIATLGTQWGVTHLEAGRASVIIVTELLTAVVSALIIAGERLAPMEWMGVALILAAALLEARPAPPPARARATV